MKFKFPKLNYNKIIHHATFSLDVLFALFILTLYLNYLSVFWNEIIIYIFYFIVAVNTIFLASKIKQIPEEDRKDSKMIYYFSHFFLLTLVVITINQFMKKAWIIQNLNYISAVSIALGFLTFYAYKDKVEREIEEEKINEEKAEEKRFGEFGEKFPFWNRIPILRRFVRWMYKEGWGYSVGLIVIVVIFFIIKIYFSLFHPIIVSDDVQAIFIGNSILHGNGFSEITSYGIPYLRGAPMSFMVALFFCIFGFSINVAKLVPAFLGSISFFIFYKLSKKLIECKKILLLTLALFVFHPLIIFNHWFVRFYVIYELFFLISIFLSISLLESLKLKKNLKSLLLLGGLLTLIVFNWFFIYDDGKNLIVFTILLEIIIIVNFKISIIKNKILYWIGIFSITIIAFFLDSVKNIIKFFLFGNLKNSEHLGLLIVLFQKNWIFSIALIIGIPLFFFSGKNNKKLIYFVVGLLVLLHLISSKDLQISRGILYFFPGLILSMGIIINQFNKTFNKKYTIFIICIFIFATYLPLYPPEYITNHPYLEEELHYQDDLSLYNFINLNLTGYRVIQTNYEILQETFFNVTTEYIFITNEEYLKKAEYFYYDNFSKTYRQISTKTPIISNPDLFFRDIQENRTVLILAEHVYRGYLNENILNKIREELPNKKEFEGYIIYYN